MDGVSSLYRELKTEWDRQAPNLRKCGTLLDQLKVNFGFFIKLLLSY